MKKKKKIWSTGVHVLLTLYYTNHCRRKKNQSIGGDRKPIGIAVYNGKNRRFNQNNNNKK